MGIAKSCATCYVQIAFRYFEKQFGIPFEIFFFESSN
jgi:hypothetical protein